jgi:hypothetical protein
MQNVHVYASRFVPYRAGDTSDVAGFPLTTPKLLSLYWQGFREGTRNSRIEPLH